MSPAGVPSPALPGDGCDCRLCGRDVSNELVIDSQERADLQAIIGLMLPLKVRCTQYTRIQMHTRTRNQTHTQLHTHNIHVKEAHTFCLHAIRINCIHSYIVARSIQCNLDALSAYHTRNSSHFDSLLICLCVCVDRF